jgi:hypothetical protein
MKRTGSAKKISNGSVSSIKRQLARGRVKFFVCVDNDGYDISLQRSKVYVAVPDARAARDGYLRIIDETGEDYLFEKECFVEVALPATARQAVISSIVLVA